MVSGDTGYRRLLYCWNCLPMAGQTPVETNDRTAVSATLTEPTWQRRLCAS